ncbi:MerR family transcriptional regulator [Microbispora sp. H10836]|uniref:MerR family transcriptional regulator n=1 Tax=Microbispora sp. H10836 TaxID=2729106 RepID=UPI00201614C7|nr:MerR family transcriptional regulator [Microbispora sp. H10836]
MANEDRTGPSKAQDEIDGVLMPTRFSVQAALKSNGVMESIPIGEAAGRFGLNPSTLRYYEERGLVWPSGRERGRRMYGPEELRRLAFVHMVKRLDIPLDVAAAVLDQPRERWRHDTSRQIHQLDDLIARARAAREFLTYALDCPAEHPARDCPHLLAVLDELVGGAPFDRLVASLSEGSVAAQDSGRERA